MKKIIHINGTVIGYGRKPFLIAEAGVNHNGKLSLAKKMILTAKKAGADAVKFQTFKATQVTIAQNPMATYQQKNTRKRYDQLTLLRKIELKDDFYPPLIALCKKVGITFLSTPHGGFDSIDLLHTYRMAAYKFGSGDLTNLPALARAARFKKPIIISSGMATMPEIQEAVRTIKQNRNTNIIALHATTNYPCPPDEVNLNAMVTMMRQLDVLVGYSDHTLGIHVPLMAATLGACMIEKHFTLDRSLPGPDHRASATPDELAELAAALGRLQTILGSTEKMPNASEKTMMQKVRKSVVSLQQIQRGEILTLRNMGIKRPGTGIKPKYFGALIGTKATRTIPADVLIKRSDYA